MAKQETTVTPEKLSMFKDYDSVIQRVLTESKREVEELQHQRELLMIKNRQMEDDLIKKQSQYEQWKRQEEQKMKQVTDTVNNDIIRREKALEIGELDMSRRATEMAHREELGKRIIAKEAKINNDRIEIEKLRSKASQLMDDAHRKMSDAVNKFSEATVREEKAKEIESKASSLNDAIVKREHLVNEKEKDVESRIKNAQELQNIVDPKIKELSSLEAKLEKERQIIDEKEKNIDNKLNENKLIITNLEYREKKIREREKQLDQKEDDIKRQLLLAGIKEE